MTPVLVVCSVVTLVLAVAVGVLVVGRTRRLHRLHIRTDAASAGLDAALRRRGTTAARIGIDVADVHGWGAPREAAENALGRRLAALDRTTLPATVRAQLADAERLVVLGRRVHNDAVRDTRALRSRRVVRFLRLYGTAPLPCYVEIADPDTVIPDATGNGVHRADVASDDRR